MTLAAAACAFLGFLLLRSAAAKLRDPATFRSILQRYPGGLWLRRPVFAMLVPSAELALALAFLIPLRLTRIAASYGMLLFVISASGAIYRRYRLGEDRFACGCSGNLHEEMAASGMWFRNAVLFLVTVFALAGIGPGFRPVDYALGLAGLLAFDLFEAALVQEGRIRLWKVRG